MWGLCCLSLRIVTITNTLRYSQLDLFPPHTPRINCEYSAETLCIQVQGVFIYVRLVVGADNLPG